MNPRAKLSQVHVVDRKYRVLYRLSTDTFIINGLKRKGAIPLFLAADVLLDSDVAKQNHTRINRGYAKQGLATRVTFSGVKVEDIHNSQSLWFYSIQGLFKVAFEHQDRAIQKTCLTHLQEWWLAHWGDPLLDEELTLGCADLLDTTGASDMADVSEGHQEVLVAVQGLDGVTSGCHPMGIFDQGQRSAGVAPGEKAMSEPCELSGDPCPACDVEHAHGTRTSAKCSVECNCALPKASQFPWEINDSGETSITTLISGLLKKIRQLKLDPSPTDQYSSHLDALETLLNLYKIDYCGENGDREGGFPLEVLERYTRLVGECDVHAEQRPPLAGTTDLSHSQSAALCVLSRWIGQQFGAMKTSVEQQVQKFKSEHINCIDNLPPPKCIVDTVFPQSMVALLTAWMWPSDENAGTGSATAHGNQLQAAPWDHDYSPPTKKLKSRDKCIDSPGSACADGGDCVYPLIQLMLEFANKSLISGVAHVVYSRLVHPNT